MSLPTAKQRADELRRDPQVTKWIADLRRVLNRAPDGVWLFVPGNSTLSVCASKPDTKDPYCDEHGGVSPDSEVHTYASLLVLIAGGEW